MKMNAIKIREADELLSLRKENKGLRRMIEGLKCCGNCKHYHVGSDASCLKRHLWTEANERCKDWIYDGMTTETRAAYNELWGKENANI